MRYNSLLNSEKWPSDSPKRLATPCFCTAPVLLFCLLFCPELRWPWPGCLYILICYIVISQSRVSCHTSFERGESGLSYDSKLSQIMCNITKKLSKSLLKVRKPRIRVWLLPASQRFVQTSELSLLLLTRLSKLPLISNKKCSQEVLFT